MSMPTYASARINYLLRRYHSIPSILYFSSRREGARPLHKDTLEAANLMNEVRDINRTYLSKPKSKPEGISKPLHNRQKEAIKRALKQELEGRIK